MTIKDITDDRVAKLSAHNSGIKRAPSVITNCPPPPTDAHLHPPLIVTVTIHQPNSSLITHSTWWDENAKPPPMKWFTRELTSDADILIVSTVVLTHRRV